MGKALARQFRELPRWDSLRRLTSEANRQYQDAATEFALREGYPDRIHIDDVLWAAPRP